MTFTHNVTEDLVVVPVEDGGLELGARRQRDLQPHIRSIIDVFRLVAELRLGGDLGRGREKYALDVVARVVRVDEGDGVGSRGGVPGEIGPATLEGCQYECSRGRGDALSWGWGRLKLRALRSLPSFASRRSQHLARGEYELPNHPPPPKTAHESMSDTHRGRLRAVDRQLLCQGTGSEEREGNERRGEHSVGDKKTGREARSQVRTTTGTRSLKRARKGGENSPQLPTWARCQA